MEVREWSEHDRSEPEQRGRAERLHLSGELSERHKPELALRGQRGTATQFFGSLPPTKEVVGGATLGGRATSPFRVVPIVRGQVCRASQPFDQAAVLFRTSMPRAAMRSPIQNGQLVRSENYRVSRPC